MKRIIGLIIVNVGAILLFGIIAPNFFTKANLIVLADNMALEAIVLSGYTLLLVGGHFDLSTDGVASLTGVVFGLLATHNVIWYLAILIAISVAIGIGILNGYIVAKLRVNGLIATLTTWWICVGFSLGMTKALAPYGFPPIFQAIGQARIFGVRILVVYAIVAVVVFSLLLHRHILGAHIYASGDNRLASEMMGIDTAKLGMTLYATVALLAGFVGIITASRLNAASPVAVDGMTLRIIAAIVIGGGNLSGGQGTVIGGLLGLSLMHILGNAAIQLGVSPYWQKAVLGSILLAAILTEKVNINIKRRKS
jgi:ribose transport system permease protein